MINLRLVSGQLNQFPSASKEKLASSGGEVSEWIEQYVNKCECQMSLGCVGMLLFMQSVDHWRSLMNLLDGNRMNVADFPDG